MVPGTILLGLMASVKKDEKLGVKLVMNIVV
jgi:hypothetical protein